MGSRMVSMILVAIPATSPGITDGISASQTANSSSVIAHAWGRLMPLIIGSRAASHSLVPPHCGQVCSLRKRETRLTANSLVARDNAFSTDLTAL